MPGNKGKKTSSIQRQILLQRIMPASLIGAIQSSIRGIRRKIRAQIAPPGNRILRIRRALLWLSLIIISTFLLLLDMYPNVPITSPILVGVLVIWLGLRWIWEYLRPSQAAIWAVSEGFAIAVVGASLQKPFGPAGLLYVALIYVGLVYRVLNLSGRRAIILMLSYNLAYASAFAIALWTAADGRMTYPGLLQLPGIAILALMGYLIARMVHGQDYQVEQLVRRSQAREAMNAATTWEALAWASSQAADLACEDAAIVVAGVQDNGLIVAAANKQASQLAAGQIIPLHLFPVAICDRLQAGEVINASRAERWWSNAASISILKSVGDEQAYILPVVQDETIYGIVIVMSSSPLAEAELASLTDITQLCALSHSRIAEIDGLRESEATFRSLVQQSSDVWIVVEENADIIYSTSGGERLLPYATDDLPGMNLLDFVHPDDLHFTVKIWNGIIANAERQDTIECRLKRGNDSYIPVEISVMNLVEDPHIRGIVLNCRDISDRIELEEQLTHQAFHDTLTGLPNRALFSQRLREALARPSHRSNSVAVMFLDLDRFKIVNDSLGHEAGDFLLAQVAGRLRSCLRSGDTVARLGGDEFAILLPDVVDDLPATRMADRILHSVQSVIDINNHQIFVTTSIGIALGRPGQDTPDDLVRHADVAMYAAKRDGKGCSRIFDASLSVDTLNQLDLESDLRLAINDQRLEVFYQPILSLATGEIQEVEALVRWDHPTRGMLTPEEFISLAEETGLILPLGHWVLRESCRQIGIWRQTTGDRQCPRMCVNLSPLQFQHEDLVATIMRTLEEFHLEPSVLKLEITESAAMRDEEQTIAILKRLRKLGIQIAVDDFGTGYSSLSALKRFPLDALKIDRSFIAGLGADSGDEAIVLAVIMFASSAGLLVTAEGIETPDQLARLQALGCDSGQGFYLARPEPPSAFAPGHHSLTRSALLKSIHAA